MKIYVVYFVTMEDSPRWEVICATTSKELADKKLLAARVREKEWMNDDETWCGEDSGNWASAEIAEFDVQYEVQPGEKVFVVFDTQWYECVDVALELFRTNDEAEAFVSSERNSQRETFPGIVPFDEDEPFEKAMHLHDDSVMVDIYFDIQEVGVDFGRDITYFIRPDVSLYDIICFWRKYVNAEAEMRLFDLYEDDDFEVFVDHYGWERAEKYQDLNRYYLYGCNDEFKFGPKPLTRDEDDLKDIVNGCVLSHLKAENEKGNDLGHWNKYFDMFKVRPFLQ